ncbi:NAD(P)-dependent oxidoreductase [Candidatus Pacearchaeota archaeon]|jgi:nucleoside-diphosphate-sugar epimerase|nr:NAD(P)-dependent oxidoreductase [Candidatus Pacearchaeota archaeon]HOC96980.1 NAD(P)-dependent oxidoreductase [Candidatus Pacearchaeota archaeon]
MKILAAGGAGYIGSSLIPELQERGYDVDVVDLLWFGNHLPEKTNVIKKDIFELDKKDLEKYEQIIFLAGLSNDPMAEFSPKKNFIYNAALPSYLAYQSKKAGAKRFIYASSCSIYGYTVDELYDENSPATCDYPYGISKLQGENGCLKMQDNDFSVIALRQGTVSGYSPRMRTDLIVNTMFKTSMLEKKININNPSIWRPILDIRDAVNAYLRAIQANYKISGPFNVASGNYTVGQVGDLVKEEIEKRTKEKINMEIKNIQDFRNYKVSTEKARVILGFIPKYSVQETIDHLFENKDKIGHIGNPDYQNINMFKRLEE